MEEMNENYSNNEITPSTNKFIFADAFYSGLSEDEETANTNLENNIPSQEQSNIMDISDNEISDGLQFDENGIVTSDSEIEEEPKTEEEKIINEYSSQANMDFLLANNSTSQEPENNNHNEIEENSDSFENNIDQSLEENTSENNLNNEHDLNEDLLPEVLINHEPEEPENKIIEMDNPALATNQDKEKFTQFLLGDNVNYQVVNQSPEEIYNNEIQEQNLEPVTYTDNLDDSLNVQSGIDTNLENFLFSRRTVAETEKENEFAPYLKNIEPEEKPIYRAARRKNINPMMDYYEKEEPKTEEIPNEPKNGIIEEQITEEPEDDWKPEVVETPVIITEEINYDEPVVYEEDDEIVLSNLLDELREKSKKTGKISILAKYGDDFCSRNYITNPAIGRDREIKELGLILLTPEKSAILVGKPGIGKTSIVEGLAYRIQRNRVPDALKGYRIISVKTTSLLGSLPTGETRLQTLIDEIKDLDKIILFVDEVHMLMGATNESSLDFANMFKESLGRGSIKMIGATTTEEYERYVLRDKAFVRRFQRVDVAEPTKEETVEILMGTLPKIEKKTGAKLKYSHYLQSEIMSFIVDITSEYKRVYGIGSRYPDICITLVSQAFSEAIFDNRNEVNILDIRNAIQNSKNIYPDVINKELINFDTKFRELIDQENK